MWVVILYMCISGQGCGFAESPAMFEQKECEAKRDQAIRSLNANPEVVAFDAKCIHIKMSES